MAARLVAQLLAAATWSQPAAAEPVYRDVLLMRARTRINSWYANKSMMDKTIHQEGVLVSMIKEDMQCGGEAVPVTFAEFDVKGARPVDIFNTMLDTPNAIKWNPQFRFAAPLGEYREQGVRGWAVVFEFPVLGNREMYQFQAADANFETQEFWLGFTTNGNEKLKTLRPLEPGSTEAQNCLGAYKITATPAGSHVIITQHVNFHPFVKIPLHQVLDMFPTAWSGTVGFINQLSAQSRTLNNGSDPSETLAPDYMLQDKGKRQAAASSEKFVASQDKTSSLLVWLVIASILGLCICLGCGFGIYKMLCGKKGQKSRTSFQKPVQETDDSSMTLDSETEVSSLLYTDRSTAR